MEAKGKAGPLDPAKARSARCFARAGDDSECRVVKPDRRCDRSSKSPPARGVGEDAATGPLGGRTGGLPASPRFSRKGSVTLTAGVIGKLHAYAQGGSTLAGGGEAGEWKKRNNEIIEILSGGDRRVRFVPAAAKDTPGLIDALCRNYREACDNEQCLLCFWPPPSSSTFYAFTRFVTATAAYRVWSRHCFCNRTVSKSPATLVCSAWSKTARKTTIASSASVRVVGTKAGTKFCHGGTIFWES